MIFITGIPCSASVGVKPPTPVEEYPDFIFAIMVPVTGHSLDTRRPKRVIFIAGIPCPASVGVKPPTPVEEHTDLIFAIMVPVTGHSLDTR
jgi:hypothetical protein